MKIQFTIFALLAIVCLVRSEEASSVIDLDSDNFDQIVNQNDIILVEFFAPWCGHCKKLAPEYEKAAEELKGIVPIAKVNADEEKNKPLASRFGIRGFPTLKIFRKGIPSDYKGERTTQSIVANMKKQAKPAISPLKTAEEVTAFSTEDKVVIVGFFENKDSTEYTQFKEVAEALRNNFLFGEVIGNADLAKQFGAETQPNVVLFKKFDEGKNVFGSENFAQLNDFITKSSSPIIDEIGPENYQAYAESKLPLVYLFVDLKVEGQKDTYVEHIKAVAKETKGKINFVYIDWSKYAKHAEKLGLSGKNVPALAMEETEGGNHFAFDETAEINAAAVTAWINQFLEGKLQPTIKSEEIPASNDAPVKIVVAKSFNDIVLDNSKDVLVEFYAPWCGHCKKLVPIYDELATTLKDVPSVVIAKMDATANDVDGKLGVRGFPTLKLFPAGNKTPIDYNGDRSHDDLLKFIKENVSVKFGETKDEL